MSTEKLKTTGGAIYDQLKHDILFGEFAAGSKLTIGQLQNRYDVSANTVREALVRLHEAGLVDAEDQKGFRVAIANLQKLEEITRMRLLLEVDGALHSIREGDLDWESRLVGAYHKLHKVEQEMLDGSATLETWTAADQGFHLALLSACGSELHLQYYSDAFLQFRRYVVQQLRTHGFRGEPLRSEHEEIFQAAMERDAERLRTALEAHISVYLNRERGRRGSSRDTT